MPFGRKYPRRHCEERSDVAIQKDKKGYTENTKNAQRTTEKKICVHLYNLCHLCAKNNHSLSDKSEFRQ
jgi:hypothetical protein